jgi:GTP-binding protein
LEVRVKIVSAEFVTSAGKASECPPGPRLEIAVSGRSNVGKSSLMNSLFGRKKLVKVSSTPGKTQRLNYFLVNDRFHVVDLPGYGFAQAPDAVRDQWRDMMQEYLRTRRQLVAVIQLVDSRHEPSREDREMVKWLRGEQLSFCLVASKIDKLGQSKRTRALRDITDALQVPATQALVPHSSETGEGKAELLAWMSEALEAASGI